MSSLHINRLFVKNNFTSMLQRICLFLLCGFLFISCGKKKKKMSGQDEVNLQEFVDFFPEIKLPFTYADTSLIAKTDDSLLISPQIFNQFTPDSFLKKEYADVQPTLYAIGKFKDKSGALYLLSKAASAINHYEMMVTAYNNKQQFIAGIPILKYKKSAGTSTTITIDNLFNIKKSVIKRLPNDIQISGEDVYVLNNVAKQFTLVMTDSLGDDAELINPIDTLGTKYKYAGDYGKGNRNIISIRDDIRPNRLQFFIHLEEKNSDCSGELSGEAVITSEKTAEYRKPGDPCVLQFQFATNAIVLTEIKGCGSRMGALDCTFNGSYPKKKKVAKNTTGATK